MLFYDIPETYYHSSEHFPGTVHTYAATPTFHTDRPYVLIADDNTDILSVVLMLLEMEGYDGVGFGEGQRVLRFLEDIHQAKMFDSLSSIRFPSIMLLDLMMPGGSGYEIVSWLSRQAWGVHIPSIIMTAYPRISNLQTLPGVIEVLEKPFDLDTLLTKLEVYLRA